MSITLKNIRGVTTIDHLTNQIWPRSVSEKVGFALVRFVYTQCEWGHNETPATYEDALDDGVT